MASYTYSIQSTSFEDDESTIYEMSLLILGPKALGKEIKVYLHPFVDDIKQLWSGVQAGDVSMKEMFTF